MKNFLKKEKSKKLSHEITMNNKNITMNNKNNTVVIEGNLKVKGNIQIIDDDGNILFEVNKNKK